jgi:hypothetical protein
MDWVRKLSGGAGELPDRARELADRAREGCKVTLTPRGHTNGELEWAGELSARELFKIRVGGYSGRPDAKNVRVWHWIGCTGL